MAHQVIISSEEHERLLKIESEFSKAFKDNSPIFYKNIWNSHQQNGYSVANIDTFTKDLIDNSNKLCDENARLRLENIELKDKLKKRWF